MTHSLFMCPPDYFGIEYEINPWMSVKRQADRRLAQAQWKALHDFLTIELALKVQLINQVSGLPDMVFTANAGIARDRKFILSNFRNKERAGETPHYESWFKDRGYSIYRLPPSCFFEGEGDILFSDESTAFAGYLIRSDVKAHATVAEQLGVRIVSLELVDPRFYHLDTCFCPLSADSAVYYPGAFDAYALDVMKANFSDRIEVTQAEAEQFVCNAIVIKNHYIQATGGRQTLRPALIERGYHIHEFDMSEFIKAGGATKCLVLKLTEASQRAKCYN